MKWILTLVYILSALLVSSCTSHVKHDRQVMAAPLDTIIEHPLTAQVRELSWQLLQQPYFVQGSFEHGQLLYIPPPKTIVALPVTHTELQRVSAEALSLPDWFDIKVLTEQESSHHAGRKYSGYSLVISILKMSNTDEQQMLTLELINNRFNTVEAYVSSPVYL